jgi:hypothetical protein
MSNHWLHSTSTSNRYTALLDEEKGQQDGPGNTPKPPPMYVSDVTTVFSLIQLLEQIGKQQYELEALSNNHTSLNQKTNRISHLQIKGRNYRVVLKNMHYSINLEEIKAEISNNTKPNFQFPCFLLS